jgi:hypothetical protein
VAHSFHQQKQAKIVRLISSGSFSDEARMTIISRTVGHAEILRVHTPLKEKKKFFFLSFSNSNGA